MPGQAKGRWALSWKPPERIVLHRADLGGDMVIGHDLLRNAGKQRRMFRRPPDRILRGVAPEKKSRCNIGERLAGFIDDDGVEEGFHPSRF